MSFNGKLMEMRRPNASVYDNFPLEWIVAESYKATPQQRLDTSQSKRDQTGVLHRTVLAHRPTKVEFNLMENFTNVEVAQFNTFMRNHYTNELQRKFVMRYYDDETDSYREGKFYMPDPQYTKRQVNLKNNVIKYAETRIAFIEY